MQHIVQRLDVVPVGNTFLSTAVCLFAFDLDICQRQV